MFALPAINLVEHESDFLSEYYKRQGMQFDRKLGPEELHPEENVPIRKEDELRNFLCESDAHYSARPAVSAQYYKHKSIK